MRFLVWWAWGTLLFVVLWALAGRAGLFRDPPKPDRDWSEDDG